MVYVFPFGHKGLIFMKNPTQIIHQVNVSVENMLQQPQ